MKTTIATLAAAALVASTEASTLKNMQGVMRKLQGEGQPDITQVINMIVSCADEYDAGASLTCLLGTVDFSGFDVENPVPVVEPTDVEAFSTAIEALLAPGGAGITLENCQTVFSDENYVIPQCLASSFDIDAVQAMIEALLDGSAAEVQQCQALASIVPMIVDALEADSEGTPEARRVLQSEPEIGDSEGASSPDCLTNATARSESFAVVDTSVSYFQSAGAACEELSPGITTSNIATPPSAAGKLAGAVVAAAAAMVAALY